MKKIFLLLYTVTGCGMHFLLPAQSKVNTDSLKNLLGTLKPDTNKVNVLNELSFALKYTEVENVKKWTNEAITIAQKQKFYKGMAVAQKIQGILFDESGKYPEAVKVYLQAATNCYKAKDTLGAARVQGNIAMVYRRLNKQRLAMQYFYDALPVFERKNFEYGKLICYENIGICYQELNVLDSALYFFQKGLDQMNKMGVTEAYVYGNMGIGYMMIGQTEKALPYLEKSIEESIRSGRDKASLSLWYQNLGTAYFKMGKYPKALDALNKSVGLLDNIYTHEAATPFKVLKVVYAKLGDYKKAYEAQTTEMEIRDSIFNVADIKAIDEMKSQYEDEKQKLIIANLNQQRKLDDMEKASQRRQKIWYAIAMGVFGVIGLLLLYAFLQKRKSNRIILQQKKQVEEQKHMVEEKNKEILDSITYAKRLQDAILPSKKIVTSYLKNSFILFKPRDIVAGDFYWMETIQPNDDGQSQHTILFAVADCTGHGVPGAMVSVIGANGLNRCVNEFGLTQPAQILDKLTVLVEETFVKSDNEVKDGMDISLCALNLETGSLSWAGANNPLWIMRQQSGEMEEHKADKQPVGKFDNRKPFTHHQIRLQKGDTVYLFSDGFSDQFGGSNGKKLKNAQFKILLTEIRTLSMDEQLARIEKYFENWKGELEQVDDVCVIGVRV